MLSDCEPCVQAGRICRDEPEKAKALHETCTIINCFCAHVVPA